MVYSCVVALRLHQQYISRVGTFPRLSHRFAEDKVSYSKTSEPAILELKSSTLKMNHSATHIA